MMRNWLQIRYHSTQSIGQSVEDPGLPFSLSENVKLKWGDMCNSIFAFQIGKEDQSQISDVLDVGARSELWSLCPRLSFRAFLAQNVGRHSMTSRVFREQGRRQICDFVLSRFMWPPKAVECSRTGSSSDHARWGLVSRSSNDAERQNVSRHLDILRKQKKAPNIQSTCRTFWNLSSGVTVSPQKFFSTLQFSAAGGHEQDSANTPFWNGEQRSSNVSFSALKSFKWVLNRCARRHKTVETLKNVRWLRIPGVYCAPFAFYIEARQ